MKIKILKDKWTIGRKLSQNMLILTIDLLFLIKQKPYWFYISNINGHNLSLNSIFYSFFLKLFYAKTFDSGLEGGDDEVEMDVEEYSYSRFLEHMYRMASQRCSIETFPELSKYGDVESIKGNIEQNDKRIQGQFLAFLWLSSIPTPCHWNWYEDKKSILWQCH